MSKRVGLLTLAFALLVVSCGGNEDSSANSVLSPPESPSVTETAESSAAPEPVAVAVAVAVATEPPADPDNGPSLQPIWQQSAVPTNNVVVGPDSVLVVGRTEPGSGPAQVFIEFEIESGTIVSELSAPPTYEMGRFATTMFYGGGIYKSTFEVNDGEAYVFGATDDYYGIILPTRETVIVDTATDLGTGKFPDDFEMAGFSGDALIGQTFGETIAWSTDTGQERWLVPETGSIVATPDRTLIVRDDGTSLVVDPADGSMSDGPTFEVIPRPSNSEEDISGLTCGYIPMRQGRSLCDGDFLVQDGRIISLDSGQDMTPADCERPSLFRDVAVCLFRRNEQAVVALIDLGDGRELATAPLAAGDDDDIFIVPGLDHIAVTIDRSQGDQVGDVLIYSAST
jgi:hypothetical protein